MNVLICYSVVIVVVVSTLPKLLHIQGKYKNKVGPGTLHITLLFFTAFSGCNHYRVINQDLQNWACNCQIVWAIVAYDSWIGCIDSNISLWTLIRKILYSLCHIFPS